MHSVRSDSSSAENLKENTDSKFDDNFNTSNMTWTKHKTKCPQQGCYTLNRDSKEILPIQKMVWCTWISNRVNNRTSFVFTAGITFEKDYFNLLLPYWSALENFKCTTETIILVSVRYRNRNPNGLVLLVVTITDTKTIFQRENLVTSISMGYFRIIKQDRNTTFAAKHEIVLNYFWRSRFIFTT